MALERFYMDDILGTPLYEARKDDADRDADSHLNEDGAAYGVQWPMKWGSDPAARQEIYLKALMHGLEMVPPGHVFEVRTKWFPEDGDYRDFGRVELPPATQRDWGVAWYYEVSPSVDVTDNDHLGLFVVSHVDKSIPVTKGGYRLAARIRSPEVQK